MKPFGSCMECPASHRQPLCHLLGHGRLLLDFGLAGLWDRSAMLGTPRQMSRVSLEASSFLSC